MKEKINAGIELYDKGKYQEAFDLLSEIIKTANNDTSIYLPQAYMWRAWATEKLNHPDAVQQMFEDYKKALDIVERFPAEVNGLKRCYEDIIHNDRGDLYFNNADYENALKDYKKVLESGRNDIDEKVYWRVCQINFALEDYPALEKACSVYMDKRERSELKVVGYSSPRCHICFFRGHARMKQAKHKEALDDYIEVLKTPMMDAFDWIDLAVDISALFEEFELQIDNLADLCPEYKNELSNAIVFFCSDTSQCHGFPSYEKALELNPDNEYAYYFIGLEDQSFGNIEDALDAFNKAIAINGNFIAAIEARAELYRERGEIEKALADTRKIRELQFDQKSKVESELSQHFFTEQKQQECLLRLEKYGNRYELKDDSDNSIGDPRLGKLLDEMYFCYFIGKYESACSLGCSLAEQAVRKKYRSLLVSSGKDSFMIVDKDKIEVEKKTESMDECEYFLLLNSLKKSCLWSGMDEKVFANAHDVRKIHNTLKHANFPGCIMDKEKYRYLSYTGKILINVSKEDVKKYCLGEKPDEVLAWSITKSVAYILEKLYGEELIVHDKRYTASESNWEQVQNMLKNFNSQVETE